MIRRDVVLTFVARIRGSAAGWGPAHRPQPATDLDPVGRLVSKDAVDKLVERSAAAPVVTHFALAVSSAPLTPGKLVACPTACTCPTRLRWLHRMLGLVEECTELLTPLIVVQEG